MTEHAHTTSDDRRTSSASGAGRRSLCGVLAALVALPATASIATAAVEPDAKLAAIGQEAGPLIERHDALSDEWFALSDTDRAGIDRVGDAIDPIYERLSALVDQTREIPATSITGFRAKAMLLRWEFLLNNRCKSGVHFGSEAEEAALELFQDLIATGAA